MACASGEAPVAVTQSAAGTFESSASIGASSDVVRNVRRITRREGGVVLENRKRAKESRQQPSLSFSGTTKKSRI